MTQKRAFAYFSFLLAILFAVPVHVWGEVFALPTSDRLLTFEVTVPGFGKTKEVERGGKLVKVLVRTKFRVITREGSLFQIQDKTRGYWFGFVANLEKSGAVSVSQFGIVSPTPRVQNATGPFLSQEIKRDQVVTFFGSPSIDQKSDPKPKLDVRLKYVGVTNGSFPDAPPFRGTWDNSDEGQMESLRQIYGDPGEAICCVGCGPIRVCADSVGIPGCGECGSGGGYGQI